ncbi:PPM-type phosphatase domain-containing protein, variant 2 [Balamuthia mandrillaris]
MLEDYSGRSNGRALYACAAATRGRRPYMEDTSAVLHTPFCSLFGLYDGHGGTAAASFAKKKCLQNVQQQLETLYKSIHDEHKAQQQNPSLHLSSGEVIGKEDAAEQKSSLWKDAFTAAFLKTDDEFLSSSGGSTSGTTALVAAVADDRIVIANAGDSRAVLVQMDDLDGTKDGTRGPVGTRVRALSDDHKADRPDEVQRIKAAGGFVTKAFDIGRVAGILAVSRALGDKELKSKGVIATPEVHFLHFTSSSADDAKTTTKNEREMTLSFLVLATDGLWDVLSNKDVGQALSTLFIEQQHQQQKSFQKEDELDPSIQSYKFVRLAAEMLIKEAYRRGSSDNITAIVVKLPSSFSFPT